MPRRIGYVLAGLVLIYLMGGLVGPVAGASSSAIVGAAEQPADTAAWTGRSGAARLEEEAEALYKLVLKGDVIHAREKSEEISRLFVASSYEGLTSVEGIHALAEVIMDVKATFAAAEISAERWEAAAARLRLAANSLNQPRQPMWLQYYKVIREDLNEMERSAGAGDPAGWKSAVDRLQSRYDNIRPAVVISRSPEAVNQFDSWLSYAAEIQSSSQQVPRARLLEIISYGQEAVRVLFGKERNEPALSRPLPPEQYGMWGWLGGAFILTALSYAAYRKYRGAKEEWKPV
ncbi:sporulation protein YpjB [Paenibacillus tengchongensis]|uniref:sporulation protein YpjB n=1 Tax=Paenibacillus tengchongensis TaxID=2608684 RepID=UPI00124F5A2A|nr:sporulation protein YpjB [Paenibacillus tengchongensis]